ncbi:TraB/GumN family protein [Flavobacterium sp. TP390]|uniref:TraB/GumN family protein n=1 Tax=Flavobacterium profundi TaxID=1774945 RepID=A0A6I4IK44_9FLAO|nr:TraB/GumN family protein [Flavobacterium profundi]MVO08539.1 TraB/GumN family protein [Flavobacterium profundi]
MIRIIVDLVKFSVVFALMIFSYLANAQKLENSLLWKISGNGIEKPSYLYGTMHAVCETNIDDDVLKAFDETLQLYLEIDMDDPNLQATMMRKVMMKDGVTVSSLITTDEAKKLDTFLKENTGFSLQMIDSFKPFMISSMYLPKLLDCPMKAVDMELMKIAKEQNEEIYGLETIEDQMNVFDKIPYKIQVEELLKASNDNLVSDKDEMAKMLAVYKSENIEGILTLSKEFESKMFTEYENDLIVQRNNNWIPIIEKVTKSKPTFFAVGAAHLAGQEGVIKLLRKQGYTVEAVK